MHIQRREFKANNIQTSWLSLPLPAQLHEDLRELAWRSRKATTLLITELLQKGVDELKKGVEPK